jgi:hypothetical protein
MMDSKAAKNSDSISVRLSQLFDPIAQIGLDAPPSPAPDSGAGDQLCRMSGLSEFDHRLSTASSSSIHSVLSDFAGDLEEIIASPNSSCWALLSTTNAKDVSSMYSYTDDNKPVQDLLSEDVVDDEDGINWQERSLELELALERFRDHAVRLRDIFTEKVSVFFC